MKLFKKKNKEEEYSETPMDEDDASLPPPPPPPLEESHPAPPPLPPLQTSQMTMMDTSAAASSEDRALIRKVTGIKEDGTAAANDQPGSTAPNTPENENEFMNPRESFASQGPAMSGRFRGMRSAQTFDEEEAGMDEIEVPSSSVVTRLSRKEQERAEKRQACMAKCKRMVIIFFIFVVIAAIVVGAVVGTRGGGANGVEDTPLGPTTPEESPAADILLEQNIISTQDLEEVDEESPVYSALKFVSENPKFRNPNDLKDENLKMEMKQVFAAATLFNSMKGDNTGRWDNWMTDEPICTWYGIECNDDGYYYRRRVLEEGGKVTSIDLAENGLTGAIPSQLFAMEHLERLILFSNRITGELPKELYSLPNFNYLDLDNNNVSGQISPDIGNLDKLEFLYLSNNEFTGPIPREIGKLVNVKAFWMSNNAGVTGEIPPEMGNMRSLRDLRLDSMSLTGRIPTTFADLALNVMSLERNGLSGGFPDDLEFISGLEYLLLSENPELFNGVEEFPYGILAQTGLVALSLTNTGLSTQIPEEIMDMISLRYLLLDNNQMKGELPAGLFDLSEMEQLNLSQNAFEGELSIDIQNYYNLMLLDLADNKFEGNIPGEIGDLPFLTVLNLRGNQFDGELPESLGMLGRLKKLEVSGNWLSGGIPDSFAGLSEMTILRLDNNLFNGEIPEFIGEEMTSLVELWLHFNRWYDDTTRREYFGFEGFIPESIGNLANLEKLYLQGNSLEGEIPDVFGKLYNLKEFRFDNNEYIWGSMPLPVCQLGLDVLISDCDYDCGQCCTDCRNVDY